MASQFLSMIPKIIELQIEHLHIEKKYLQGDAVKKILTEGGINSDEAKQVGIGYS